MGGSPFPTWPGDAPKPPCQNHRVLINVAPNTYICAACDNVYTTALNPTKAK